MNLQTQVSDVEPARPSRFEQSDAKGTPWTEHQRDALDDSSGIETIHARAPHSQGGRAEPSWGEFQLDAQNRISEFAPDSTHSSQFQHDISDLSWSEQNVNAPAQVPGLDWSRNWSRPCPSQVQHNDGLHPHSKNERHGVDLSQNRPSHFRLGDTADIPRHELQPNPDHRGSLPVRREYARARFIATLKRSFPEERNT